MIIVEGIDGVGKSSFVESMSTYDYKRHHFEYDQKRMDLFSKYETVLDKSDERTALDRSFVSEMVYGPVIRGFSKISDVQFIQLLKLYQNAGFKLFYLHASRECLLQRRASDEADFYMLKKYYEELSSQYEKIIDICSNYLDVFSFNSELMSVDEMKMGAKKVLKL